MIINSHKLLAPDAEIGGGGDNATVLDKGTLSEGSNDNVDPGTPSEGSEAFDIGEITGDVPSSTPQPSVTTQDETDILTEKQDKRQAKPVSTTANIEAKPVSKGKTEVQPQQQGVVGKRDYSKITNQEDLEFAKKLPNHIFNHVAPILEKKSALERQIAETQEALKKEQEANKNPNRIPETWYDHEDAFTLTPEYKQISGLYDRASFEANHWEKQILAAKQKKPVYGLDFKNNQYSLTGPFEPSDELELNLQKAHSEALKLQDRFETQAEQIATSFRNEIKSADSFYQTEAKKRFDQLHPDLKPKDEVVKTFIDGFIRPAHRKHPLATLCGQMFSIIANQGTMLGGFMTKEQKAKQIANDRRAAGPVTKTGVSGKLGASGNGEVIDLDALKSEMEGDN